MGTGLQTWSPGLLFPDVMPLPSRLSEEIHQGSPEPRGAGQSKGSTCRLVLVFFVCCLFVLLPSQHRVSWSPLCVAPELRKPSIS